MGSLAPRIAAKHLAAVEIRPSASHQHEFNAGKLRAALGFPPTRVSAPLTVIYRTSDDLAPTVEETTYTLYDAREQVPNRTEWRLYYKSEQLQRLAREGDLLVLTRASGNALRAIVARPGTRSARELERAVLGDELASVDRFAFFEPRPLGAEDTARVLETLVDTSTPVLDNKVHAHPLFAAAVGANAMPSGRDMAKAAQELVGSDQRSQTDPDSVLDEALIAETALYYAIESELGTRRLDEVHREGGLGFSRVLEFAMRIHQSRRARRGRSLESHFAILLERNGIPYNDRRTQAKCKTEGAEIPDFVVPGCEEYANLAFPTDRLRMIACKSTDRERWRQILREAERIQEKYLLTIDEDLTDSVVREMSRANLRAFLPKRILDRTYGTRPVRTLLGTVSQLLDELKAVV